MIGERFGKLVVSAFSHRDERHRKWWSCACDCGGASVLHTGNLRSGNTKSCGCLVKESAHKRRKSVHQTELTAVILGYKRHAKDRGYSWGLTREEVAEIISRPCHYCGLGPSNVKVTKNTISPMRYSGIDRVDNSAGYCAANVVPCCANCNRAKQHLSASEFFAWAKRLSAMAEQWGGNA